MNELTTIEVSSGTVLPALIAEAGERAARRFVEFFTVNIRNPNTRAAYGRAAAAFLYWCERQGISSLADVQPMQIAAYIEQLEGQRSALTVKQHLACIRMLSGPEQFLLGPPWAIRKKIPVPCGPTIQSRTGLTLKIIRSEKDLQRELDLS